MGETIMEAAPVKMEKLYHREDEHGQPTVELLGEEDEPDARCRLLAADAAKSEEVDAAVSSLMNATLPWTRSEYRALIEGIFNAGVRSVVHQRG
jgi:hypothetical protein